MDTTQVLLSSVSTEKAVRATAENQHTFYIAAGANKIEVAKAVKQLYGVLPAKVQIVKLPTKTTGRGRLKRKVRRKAIVILKKGDKLDPLKIK